MVKTYKTHHNGTYAFKVVIDDAKIIIFKNVSFEPDEWIQCLQLNTYKKIFIGKNTKKYTINKKYGLFPGSSILIELKPLHYMFIGSVIRTFKTSEPIIKFYSIMGNNDVTYPFAMSEQYVYLMLDMVKSKRVKNDPDPYASFYKYDQDYDEFKRFVSKLIIKDPT